MSTRAAGLSDAERSIADALAAIDYLRASMAADSAMLRSILARRDHDGQTLAKIRADLRDRLRHLSPPTSTL